MALPSKSAVLAVDALIAAVSIGVAGPTRPADHDREIRVVPMAAKSFSDPTSLPAYQAIAEHLAANSRR